MSFSNFLPFTPAYRPPILPQPDREYEPSEAGTGSSDNWSTARSDNSGARAMYWIAAHQRKAPNPGADFNPSLPGSRAHSDVDEDADEDLFERWDHANPRGSHWKDPLWPHTFTFLCALFRKEGFFTSLFVKTPEEHMSCDPWWCYPVLYKPQQEDWPQDDTWVRIYFFPNLRWTLDVRGPAMLGINVKPREDGSIDLRALKEKWGLDNIKVVDRDRQRYHETVDPDILPKMSACLVGLQKTEDAFGNTLKGQAIRISVCEYHDIESWRLRQFRVRIRWVFKLIFYPPLIVLGCFIAAFILQVLLYHAGRHVKISGQPLWT